MITIKIGEDVRTWNKNEADWINQQISGRRAAGDFYCVRVSIREPGITIDFSTANCYSSGSGVPNFNYRELAVIELWKKCGLNESDFSGGNLISFLKQFESQF